MTCTVEGCNRPHKAKGMCKVHYLRVQRHGSTEQRSAHGLPVTERILRYSVEDANGCWVWQRSRMRKGYGQINIADVQLLAHRVSYEAFVGAIPEGLTLDHLCRNTSCVNPAHLEPVTVAENLRRGHRARLIEEESIAQDDSAGTHRPAGSSCGGENLQAAVRASA